MTTETTDLALKALAYFKQVQGDRLPAHVGMAEVQQLIDRLASGPGASGEALSLDKLIALMQQLAPVEDPRDPKLRKRRRIVQAATELFVKNGYRKTSIDDVARRAHVAKGTVYLYFKNKPALLLQAISDEKLRMASTMQQALADVREPRQQLRAWLEVYFRSLREMPLTARMIGGDREVLLALEELGDAFQLDTMAIQHDFIARMIQGATSPPLPEAVAQGRARVLLAQLYTAGALLDERVRGGLDEDRYIRLLVGVLVDGVASPVTGGSP